MNELDFIRKSITECTIELEGNVISQEVYQYFYDLVRAMEVSNLKLLSINTIESKTYIIQDGNNQFYLVYNLCLLDSLKQLNSMLFGNGDENRIKLFTYRILSGACFNYRNLLKATQIANKYYDILVNKKAEITDNVCDQDYLFVQQIFMISHEFFHYFFDMNQNEAEKNILSMMRIINWFAEKYVEKYPDEQNLVKDAFGHPDLVLECLCDSTAATNAIQGAVRIIDANPADCSLAICAALMNQCIISRIQNDTLVISNNKDQLKILFSSFYFRIEYLMFYIDEYLSDEYGEEVEKLFWDNVCTYETKWLNTIYPVIDSQLIYLNNENDILSFSENQKRDFCTIKSIVKEMYEIGQRE